MSHIEHKDLPKIAIIGRPNVGKSSLFNRILKRRKAIVESTPGVTRDRLYATTNIGGVELILIDTGGIISRPKERMSELVYRQSKEALAESDAIIFVCDVTSGVTSEDEHITMLIRKSSIKTFLAINKVDNNRLQGELSDFYRLGLGEPYGLSALNGTGIKELSAAVVSYILTNEKFKEAAGKKSCREVYDRSLVKMAIVGRPNVGKSSFVNCILNQERLIVDEVPGTTRDSIDVHIKRNQQNILLIDTAGIKHKKKLKETVEVFSLARTRESIKRSDIALVMIDIIDGLCRDDIAVIDYVIKEGKPCILLVNKRDLVANLGISEYAKRLRASFKPLTWIHMIFTSCYDKKNIIKAFDAACELAKRANQVIPDSQLMEVIEKAQKIKQPPFSRGRRPAILYATQAGTAPATFLLSCLHQNLINEKYLRFMENSLRRRFNLSGIPIRFTLKGKD